MNPHKRKRLAKMEAANKAPEVIKAPELKLGLVELAPVVELELVPNKELEVLKEEVLEEQPVVSEETVEETPAKNKPGRKKKVEV